jgi:NAD(P)-dependent dehydrogenase (short-subunit alcohol dehydrogenase family)
MLLEDRIAIIYGGGGAIGSAVGRAFARHGARVHLVGRSLARVQVVAEEICACGGRAEAAEVDALDAIAVEDHADMVVERDGRLDISLNVIAYNFVQGTPFVDMTVADYEQPIVTALRTTFLTWRAAGRHMRRQGSGVILAFGGEGAPMPDWYLGGTQTAFSVVESMRRQVAAELGRHGVRVVTLQTAGILDTVPAAMAERDEIIEAGLERSLLHRAATREDVGHAAVFAASDWGRTLTATQLNITCGTEVD